MSQNESAEPALALFVVAGRRPRTKPVLRWVSIGGGVVALVALLTLVVWWLCSGPSKDYRAMEAMAERLRADVAESARKANMARAENVAIASCFFAREMECVAGKAPRVESTVRSDGGGELRAMRLAEWERLVNSTVLKADRRIGGLDEDGYKDILHWVLSDDDLRELDGIRARHGYWTQLRTALER